MLEIPRSLCFDGALMKLRQRARNGEDIQQLLRVGFTAARDTRTLSNPRQKFARRARLTSVRGNRETRIRCPLQTPLNSAKWWGKTRKEGKLANNRLPYFRGETRGGQMNEWIAGRCTKNSCNVGDIGGGMLIFSRHGPPPFRREGCKRGIGHRCLSTTNWTNYLFIFMLCFSLPRFLCRRA